VAVNSLQPRTAAVLVLAYPKLGEPHIVFTKRSETVADHKGQISLPGGSWELADASLEVTALREAEEEVGIRAADVRVLGRLEDVYVQVSNFLIAPYVGVLDYAPEFHPDPIEVAHLIEVPLQGLRGRETLHEEEWLLGGRRRPVQYYQCGPHQIWGATARVVQLFLESDLCHSTSEYFGHNVHGRNGRR
jgi:8-oxo-dGTP pyrophosphatase MutT (NUDIX family)